MVDQEAMFDDQEAMLDDQEAMFDDQEAMCVLMHFMVQPSFDLGCDNCIIEQALWRKCHKQQASNQAKILKIDLSAS